MRHHFAAIGLIAGEPDAGKNVCEYIRGLTDALLSSSDKQYCTNYAANAVVAHYLGIAESEGISVEAQLIIPNETGNVPAMDICIILGNFLENALEACRRINPLGVTETKTGKQGSLNGGRYIRARSRIDGDTLSIVVTNSFDGIWRMENGVYISRKKGEAGETGGRGGETGGGSDEPGGSGRGETGVGSKFSGGGSESRLVGVGLSSVRAVCEKYRGLVQFEIAGDLWKSSALVHFIETTGKVQKNDNADF